MTEFSEQAREGIRSFVATDLYRRAKERVLESIEVEVVGSSRTLEQTALDLAVKEGVHRAFKELEKLALPQRSNLGPVLPAQIGKHKTHDQQ